MADEKEVVTVMILYVDLKCRSCYKKVKKLLCKFPQIRDQVFDEDNNKVIITVICCNPEKLRDKLCCKGGKAIQSIEIVEKPPPQKPPEKPKKPVPVPVPAPAPVQKPKPEEKPKDTEKPKPQPVPTPKPNPPPKKPDPPPVVMPQPPPVPQPQPPPVPQPQPEPMHGYPFCPPVSVCCQECYQGRDGGPCHYGYGRPIPPPPGPCYDGDQYRPCYVSPCDYYYFSEENPRGCSIM